MAERVTLAEIAAEAGVALSTVSKVLNGRTDVAPATRARLEEHLLRHGYQRRATARRSDFMELVFPELESAWSIEVIEGVQSVATVAGLSLVLTVSGNRHQPAADWVDGALRRRPLGVVMVFSDVSAQGREKLRSRGIPLAIVDPAGDPPEGVPSIGSANWTGGLMATRHLIDLGHRRIAAITGPDDMMCSLARIDGYRSAMNAAGLPIDPAWVRYGDFHTSGGETHTAELLALPDPPTAIFAGSDLQALGAIAAAARAGLSVPHDLSIVGYDDIPIVQHTTPQVTTVHQPLRRMGEEATRLVLRMADGEHPETLHVDLATHLVVRASTAPPRA